MVLSIELYEVDGKKFVRIVTKDEGIKHITAFTPDKARKLAADIIEFANKAEQKASG